jgi:Holliday junction DNA helicase RuvA
VIASLHGVVRSKDLLQAVVECSGVGYGVAMSLCSLRRLPEVGQMAHVFVHTSLGQDALRLFGFVEAVERDTFLVLVTTPGVGPRLALTILSALSPAELAAVVRQGDKAQLCGIAGVGKKKAERLLVELQDRLPDVGDSLQAGPTAGGLRQDLHSALTNLGFALPVADRIAKEVLEADPEQTDLTVLLRRALRST